MFRSKQTSAAKRFDQIVKMQDEMNAHRAHEDEVIGKHAPRCYGDYGTCVSCGCDRPALVACVGHHNTNAYLADVIKQLTKSLKEK